MSAFVVDASSVLYLASAAVEVSKKHELLAPTLVRSETLSVLHEAVRRGEIPLEAALELRARINRLPIRLLGDAVLRRVAWEVADRLGWGPTYEAEYVALTQLHGRALVTMDGRLARRVRGLIETATLDVLL